VASVDRPCDGSSVNYHRVDGVAVHPTHMTTNLFIGLMSGTSLDGVDGVLADFSDGAIRTVAAAFTPFPADLRDELMALQAASHNELEREALAANALALAYADCVSALLPSSPGKVAAVAVHGQTIRHRPELGFTRQTNNPALLAELTGLDVIADFRSRDVAAGGQGAPLVPAFHAAAFGTPGTARVVVNILMDLWIARHQSRAYDEDGAWAASGTVHQPLLAALLDEPYFALPAPKSTGRDLFHAAWLDARLAAFEEVAPADVQATLTRLTAVTIARAIVDEGIVPDAVYVCGGGAYNGTLLRAISTELDGVTVASTAELGVAPNRVEALAFAWLGWRFTQREPGNLPAVTGARSLRILGALYPA